MNWTKKSYKKPSPCWSSEVKHRSLAARTGSVSSSFNKKERGRGEGERGGGRGEEREKRGYEPITCTRKQKTCLVSSVVIRTLIAWNILVSTMCRTQVVILVLVCTRVQQPIDTEP